MSQHELTFVIAMSLARVKLDEAQEAATEDEWQMAADRAYEAEVHAHTARMAARRARPHDPLIPGGGLMAAGVLPEPGTEYGPCVEPCQHIDCAGTRADAASPCQECGQPIGYGRRFYAVGDAKPGQRRTLSHATCLEATIDRR